MTMKIRNAELAEIIPDADTRKAVQNVLAEMESKETGQYLGMTLDTGSGPIVVQIGGLPSLADEKATRLAIRQIVGDKAKYSRTRDIRQRIADYKIGANVANWRKLFATPAEPKTSGKKKTKAKTESDTSEPTQEPTDAVGEVSPTTDDANNVPPTA